LRKKTAHSHKSCTFHSVRRNPAIMMFAVRRQPRAGYKTHLGRKIDGAQELSGRWPFLTVASLVTPVTITLEKFGKVRWKWLILLNICSAFSEYFAILLDPGVGFKPLIDFAYSNANRAVYTMPIQHPPQDKRTP
jgi:hypothetical protein